MSSDTVQIQYDQMAQIANLFSQQSEVIAKLEKLLQQNYAPLANGDWEGKGAGAFFNKMTSEIFPSVQRLTQALQTGQTITQQVVSIFQNAEQEAATLFKGGDIGGDNSSSASLGTRMGGNSGSGSVGTRLGDNSGSISVGVGSNSSSAEPKTSTPIVPADQIFSDEYMTDMIDRSFDGENSPALNEAMETLATGDASEAERNAALAVIAKERGMTMDEVNAQFERYEFLRKKAIETGLQNGEQAPPLLDQDRFPNFLGSTSSLQYGKAAGDALGLDPVFGSLLNQTGGLVGPGNAAGDMANTAVGYHGVFHDTGGYLYNYHNMGPGYQYSDQAYPTRIPDLWPTSNPLGGHVDGLRYWNEKMDTDYQQDFSRDPIGTFGGKVVDTVKAVDSGVKAVGYAIYDGASWLVDSIF